ncbi:MAG: SIS domain-containing protein [Verrucomicrobiales bacterium]|nr:SIS domain-containing protein [Verrucomicrobiales bacterium]
MKKENTSTGDWITEYLERQQQTLAALPTEQISEVIELLRVAHQENRQVFIFGNGGSACNASHFATDLGKGSSDALGKRFRVLSLNDNTGWMTAIGNDYDYKDIFRRQLENYANPGDVVITASVSGSSPNLLEAFTWAKGKGLKTVALIGAKRGSLIDIADHTIVVEDTHYGRVEDAHMTIYHLLCYAFMDFSQA